MFHGQQQPSQLARTNTLRGGNACVSHATAELQSRAPVRFDSVDCHVREGTATLVGRVSTYYLKQLAQETVRRFEGVSFVTNQLVVCSPTRAAG